MAEIRTFVFCDIETTGLPREENFQTRITEISLIACSKVSLVTNQTNDLPRLVHKLTVCVNPLKPIHPISTQMTGLDNNLLKDQNKFDENTAQLLVHFLGQLQKPICIAAHNGNVFDFPILKKHLMDWKLSFDEDLLCVDSLPIFKKCDTSSSSSENHSNQWVSYKLIEIHKRLYGSVPKVCHGAEADATNLIKCVTIYREQFVQLAEQTCVKFANIKPMGSN